MRGKTLLVKGMLVGVILVLLMVPLLTACGGDAETVATPTKTMAPTPTETEEPTQTEQPPDIMDKTPIGEVKVGHLGDLTGPGASIHSPWCKMVVKYWEYLNEEKGGIVYNDPITGEMERVTVDAIMVDTAYKAEKAISAFERFNAEGVVIEASGATGMQAAVEDLMVKYEIPTINGGFFKLLYPPEEKWCYGYYISIAEEYVATVNWLKEKWEAGEVVCGVEPDPTRNMRLGLLQSEAGWGYKWYEEGGMDWIKSVADVFGPETYPVMPVDVSTQLIKLDRDNPDFILNLGITGEIAVCMKDAARLGISAPQVTCSGATPTDVIELTGLEVAEGHIMMWFFDTYGMPPEYELSEGAKLNQYIHEKYLSGEKLSSAEMVGTAYGLLIEESVRLALEEVGYENLDGRAVKEYGLEKLKDFDVMGIPATPITYGPDDHLGPEGTNLYTVENGDLVPLQRPALVPFDVLTWE